MRNVYHALGYSDSFADSSLFSVTFKCGKFAYYSKSVKGYSTYVMEVDELIPFLKAFVKMTLMVPSRILSEERMRDNARMEAERLIDIFNRELFGKESTCTVTRIEQNISDTSEEVTQMENNETIQANVSPLSVHDIEEIGERAEATVKIFGVSKADALRATTLLKSQEINRDLSPLLELLK